MKKTNLKEKLQNWKLGNYFRELSIVTAGVFITLAGTDFINSASQEKQINKSMYNPQIQISAESETKRSIFREKDKTKRSKKESAQHSKSRNKSFVMTSVSAL